MGTSDFALPSLQKIYQNKKFNIVAIYTKAPSIAGRGQKIAYSPIYQFAQQHNLSIITPKNFKDNSSIEEFINFKADIAVVISYGIILPQEILNGTKHGCYNVHPSALPLYRGPAPLQQSILDGQKNSAVCIIKMDKGVDSGDIVNEERYFIDQEKDFPIIAKETAEIGANLLIKTMDEIENNKLILRPQNHDNATFTSKIDKNQTKINWHNNCQEIINKVRAFNGNLFSYFYYNNEKIKILSAQYRIDKNIGDENGKILDKMLNIKCQDGVIIPKILQREGKKPMNVNEFLNGFKIEIGKIL